MEIELSLADCPWDLVIFGHLTRKDVNIGDIFFDAVQPINSAAPRAGNTRKRGFDWKRDPVGTFK